MIKEIIFFEDYGLWTRCEAEAARQGIKTTEFITIKCEELLIKNNVEKVHKKAMNLWIDCDDAAKKLNLSVAQFIEYACALSIEPEKAEKRKESFLERLDRAMRLPVGK